VVLSLFKQTDALKWEKAATGSWARFKVLAVQLVPTFVCDIRIAARYLPILYTHERGAGTARRPKPNAVISFSQVGPLLLDTTLAEYHCKKFNAEIVA
jgi:hypothetical protein